MVEHISQLLTNDYNCFLTKEGEQKVKSLQNALVAV